MSGVCIDPKITHQSMSDQSSADTSSVHGIAHLKRHSISGHGSSHAHWRDKEMHSQVYTVG